MHVQTCLRSTLADGYHTVIRYRPFANSDPPTLVKLWNDSLPEHVAVRPLRVHEFDYHALGLAYFDRAGLIIAERDGRILGFVHAGFGPDHPVALTPPLSLSRDLGTIAMLVVDDSQDPLEVGRSLILEAERYLRERGTQVVYAGGLFPLNPFYWGLYGGSEGSGIVSSHRIFPQLLSSMGYELVSSTVLLEFDLATTEPRDPRSVMIRRQSEVEIHEDALPTDWWENLALSEFHLTGIRLLSRAERTELARARTWDMSWFGRQDSRLRIGMIGLEVPAEHRRRGYGRFLVGEVLRTAREQGASLVEVQTHSTNQPALALYQSFGFQPIDESHLYRLPAQLSDRWRSA
jgi:ribosomal protein S18 acetylase RimI-like enzyme